MEAKWLPELNFWGAQDQELLDEVLTLFEESYLLGSLFVPVPVILVLAISNEALSLAPRQVHGYKKEETTKTKAPPNSRRSGFHFMQK